MTGAAQMLTVRMHLAVRKPRGGRKLILTPGGMVNRGAKAADTTLVKALALAFRCSRRAGRSLATCAEAIVRAKPGPEWNLSAALPKPEKMR